MHIGIICGEMFFDGLPKNNTNIFKEYPKQFLIFPSLIQLDGKPVDTSFNYSMDLETKYNGLANFYNSIRDQQTKNFTILQKSMHLMYQQIYHFVAQNKDVIYFKPPEFIFFQGKDTIEQALKELMIKFPDHHIGIVSTKCIGSAYSECVFASFKKTASATSFDVALNDSRRICNDINQFIYLPDISNMRNYNFLLEYRRKPFDHRALFAMAEHRNLKKLDIRPQTSNDIEFLVSTAMGIASIIEKEYVATSVIIDKTDWSTIDYKAENLTMRMLSKMEARAGTRPNIFLLSSCTCGPLMATIFGCNATFITIMQN